MCLSGEAIQNVSIDFYLSGYKAPCLFSEKFLQQNKKPNT